MRTIWPSWSPSSQVPWWSSSWSLSLFWCAVAMHHDSKQLKGQQGAEWMSPNQENKQNKKRKGRKKISPELSLLNFGPCQKSKPDDAVHEPINGTISLPAELGEQSIGKFGLGPAPPTPSSEQPWPGQAPQISYPACFHLKPDTPVSVKKHHVVKAPLDNTFVGGCGHPFKQLFTSSDHFSASVQFPRLQRPRLYTPDR